MKEYDKGFSIRNEQEKSILYNDIDGHRIEVEFNRILPVEFYRWNKDNTHRYWKIL